MRLIFSLFVLLFFISCSEQDSAVVERSWGEMKGLEKLVGNMNDTSYSGVRSYPPRFNALNKAVPIDTYAGKFLWAEYAASWCSTCAKQVHETKKAESVFGSHMNFITVMTANSVQYDDHATVQTAKMWADRYQLDPQHVFAAKLWYKTIPEHRLFSPEGHTLFVHVGFLNAEQIMDIIEYYQGGWQRYQQRGEAADWMRF